MVTAGRRVLTRADAFWSANFARLAPAEAERAIAEERADSAAWLRKAVKLGQVSWCFGPVVIRRCVDEVPARVGELPSSRARRF